MKIVNKLLSGRFLALILLVVTFCYLCIKERQLDYLNSAVMLALGYYFGTGQVNDLSNK